VSPVFDQNRNYLGPMVAWEKVTEQVQAEARLAQVAGMVENSPAIMIFADQDLKVRYLNPAGEEAFRRLAGHLPVARKDIPGQPIRIFGEAFARADKLVRKADEPPCREVIELGPETFEVQVAPVRAADGRALGVMMTWQQVTEKVRMERLAREQEEQERIKTQELKDNVDRILAMVRMAAKGDLTGEVPEVGEGAIRAMGDELGRFLSDLMGRIASIAETATVLKKSSGELSTVSQNMAGCAEETSAQAGVVTAASEEISHNVQTAASGAQQMGSSIREIAKNAADAARVAMEAVAAAGTTNEVVSRLGKSSNEVGQVVKTITSIAEQTNLLALNATIEAARAGEAGKGFAVVANEVRELANQTARATDDINKKIETIQKDTTHSVSAIADITGIVDRINQISSQIAAEVEEQSQTTADIGRKVSETASGSQQISLNIAGVAQAAEETSKGVGQTKHASEDLLRLSLELEDLVGKFKY